MNSKYKYLLEEKACDAEIYEILFDHIGDVENNIKSLDCRDETISKLLESLYKSVIDAGDFILKYYELVDKKDNKPFMGDTLCKKDVLELLWHFQNECCGKVISDFEKLPTTNHWMLCADKMPEINRYVLVQTRETDVYKSDLYIMAYILGRDEDGTFEYYWYNSDENRRFETEDVVAWMPLPEKYEEKRTENY